MASASQSSISPGAESSGTLQENSEHQSSPAFEAASTSDGIKGVNLGGWLVTEPWITPALYEAVGSANAIDEWSFCSILGKSECFARLEAHRNTFITEEDIREIAASGITFLRLPVPYWMIDVQPFEPFPDGGVWKWVEICINWSSKYNLKLLIDLHTAPGSQNGFDNSGRRGDIHWNDDPTQYLAWLSTLNPASSLFAAQSGMGLIQSQAKPTGLPNVDRTLSVLKELCRRLSPHAVSKGGSVWGIELLNEPGWSLPIDLVQNFTRLGHQAIKEIEPSFKVVASDSFRPGEWFRFERLPDLFLDIHLYHMFSLPDLQRTREQHIQRVCLEDSKLLQPLNAHIPTLVGEFSLATTDCTVYLNGFGVGTRWNGTFPGFPKLGECGQGDEGGIESAGFSSEYRQFLRKFWDVQVNIFGGCM